MDELPQADELAVRELERQLYAKRRLISERRARSLAAAESALGARVAAAKSELMPILPVYPPGAWRGARQQDRYFRPLTPHPLRARVRWGLMVPASGAPRVVVKLQTAQPSRAALWAHALLTSLEVLATLALLVVVGLLYRRLSGFGSPAQSVLPTRAVPEANRMPAVVASAELPSGHAPLPELTSVQPTARPQVTTALSGTPTVPAPEAEPTTEPSPAATESVVAPSASAAALEPTSEAPMAPTSTPTLTDTPRMGLYIVIPRLRVDASIVEGDGPEQLKLGVGRHVGSAKPGEPGNMVVSAHNDVFGEIFRDLDKLTAGDEVWVYLDAAAYRYVVRSVEIVAPTRVEVMDPTDHAVLTMITCYPYLLDTHRVVVVADLVE